MHCLRISNTNASIFTSWITECLTSEHQHKTSVKCFISDVTEQSIIYCFLGFFFYLVVGAWRVKVISALLRSTSNNPNPKWPRWVFSLQLSIAPSLSSALSSTMCYWPVFSHFGPLPGRILEMQTKIGVAQELAFRMKLCSQNHFSGRPRRVQITPPLPSPSW